MSAAKLGRSVLIWYAIGMKSYKAVKNKGFYRSIDLRDLICPIHYKARPILKRALQAKIALKTLESDSNSLKKIACTCIGFDFIRTTSHPRNPSKFLKNNNFIKHTWHRPCKGKNSPTCRTVGDSAYMSYNVRICLHVSKCRNSPTCSERDEFTYFSRNVRICLHVGGCRERDEFAVDVGKCSWHETCNVRNLTRH